jgi:DNA ligase 1
MFDIVLEYLEEIANTASTNKKKEKIEKFVKLKTPTSKLFESVVFYALNPNLRFNIKNIEFSPCVGKFDETSVLVSLNRLAAQRGATDKDKQDLADICSCIGVECVEVVNRILKKDLRCGAGTKLFKEFIKVPEFSVQLADKDLDKFFKKVKNIDDVCWSYKLDGVRTIAIITEEEKGKVNVQYVSRKGLPLDFHIFDEDMKKIYDHYAYLTGSNTLMLDGEATTTEETFKSVMTELKRLKDADKSKFRFNVFDIITDGKFESRYRLVEEITLDTSMVKPLQHFWGDITCQEDAHNLLDAAVEQGYEGLVIKDGSAPYERKRTWYWTKLKKGDSADLKIVGFSPGEKKYKGMLGALIVDFNGVNVNVGTGLSDEQRKHYKKYWKIGDTIEVSYQEVTDDGSLRHPVYVRKREDK